MSMVNKFLAAVSVFFFFYTTSIGFSETNFPFSRIDMFSGQAEEVCTAFSYGLDGAIIPLDNVVEVQSLSRIWFINNQAEKSDLCGKIKSRFFQLPDQFSLRLRCAKYNRSTGKIHENIKQTLWCSNEID